MLKVGKRNGLFSGGGFLFFSFKKGFVVSKPIVELKIFGIG